MRGSPLALAVIASALIGASTAPLRAQQDTTLIEAVFRLDIEYSPSQIVPALAVDSRLLLPLIHVLDVTEVAITDSSHGHYVAAVLEPSGLAIRFDTDSMLLTVGDSLIQLGRWDAVWRDGELYVWTGYLTEALGVAVGVDWGELIAVVARTSGLPLARRVRRERARARVLRRQLPLLRPITARVEDHLADGAVFEWSLTGATDDPLGDGSAQFGLGAKLLGGSIEFHHERHRFRGGSFSQTRGSWMRAWPERQWLRQIRIGDVSTGGRRSRLLRGVVVTNQPFIRSSEFDLEEIVGEIPPGWEIELYDAGGLLDFGEADPLGGFRVALPLRYGANPFDMVLYGPRGEVVRRRRTIRVPFSRLPDRQVEYAVGLGGCHLDPCNADFSADVRYGVNRHITAQAGWDLLARDKSLLWQPYVAVSAGILPSVSLTAEAVANGLIRGQADFEPSPDLRVRLSQTFFAANGARFLGSPLDRHRTEWSLLWFGRDKLATAVQLSATRATGPGSSRTFLRAIVTARHGSVRYGVDLRHSYVALSAAPANVLSVLDLNSDLVLTSGPKWLRTATVGGGIGVGFQQGLESIRARAGRSVSRGVRVDLGLGWFRQEGLVIDLGLSTTIGGPRFGSRNRFTSGAGTQGVQYLDGSLLWDRTSGRVRFGDGRDLGRAGLAGAVFLDLDSDGTWDGDEPGLPGVPLRVGGRLFETDERGRFSLWELFPFEAVLIQIDTTAFEYPFYAVPNLVVEVTPTPNSYVSVEIPVVIGAEVSGGVLFEGQPLAGVRVTLHELNTGRRVTLTTFSDGGFYTIGVLPGSYEMSIPRGVLRLLGATAAPVRFTVPTGPGEKIIDAVILTVERER